ncbi:MAG: gamma-glutamyl-gamma-aminobutyrate hydrolase family protein [Phycisphaerae bacterium]|nr:gamma-glutamyl-gamma-aminobutyrate hydrolase family protein [Phycisphaerae bacterium]
MRPLIGITCDVVQTPDGKLRAVGAGAYFQAVHDAGGLAVLLPPVPAAAADYVDRCDGVVLTGGQDPRTEDFGAPTHPAAEPMHPVRQEFELAMLRALDRSRQRAALGICLGMQLMSLHAGGQLNQHLPDTLATADRHRKDFAHPVVPAPGSGLEPGSVASNHHQAVADAGRLRIIATSDDGVIEAVSDPDRPFYLGVQWHPERTADTRLGAELFRRLVRAASGA